MPLPDRFADKQFEPRDIAEHRPDGWVRTWGRSYGRIDPAYDSSFTPFGTWHAPGTYTIVTRQLTKPEPGSPFHTGYRWVSV